VVALIAAPVAISFFGRNLPAGYQLALWAGWMLTLGLILVRNWSRLCGPVLFYDVIRNGRRGRHVIIRCLYALVLFIVLYTVFLQYRSRIEVVLSSGQASCSRQEVLAQLGREMTKFAEAFFILFMEAQFVGIFLLTPAYTAGAIAEEKERRTLDFLLGTELTDREIVLGKLISRLASLALIFLTGLPILSMVQLWGGVDPNLVLAGFTVSAITMLGLASLSILVSVVSRNARNAILITYLIVVGYLGITAWVRSGPSSTGNFGEGTWLASGNLLVAISELKAGQARGVQLETLLVKLLGAYCLFHVLLAASCLAAAVAVLRKTALRTRPVLAVRHKKGFRGLWRPRIGSRPMLWKEVFLETGLSGSRAGRVILVLIALASFWPIVRALAETRGPYSHMELSAFVNRWVRSVGTIVAGLTLLGVGVRAAVTISGERDKQTLDSLLTSPLRGKTILWAKWLGSILGVRWAWLWLCLDLGLGFVTGAVELYILPWVLLAWFVYACFVASLGMWFSARHATSQGATMWTLGSLLLLFGGHLVLTMFCNPLSWKSGSSELASWLGHFQLYGLTPPVALGWLAFREGDFTFSYIGFLTWGVDEPYKAIVSIGIGLFVWWGASWVLWKLTERRFAALAGRVPRRRGLNKIPYRKEAELVREGAVP
jgi:ABC-type transport system involved in multi-copper enzyme maturation permease subunit